MKKLKDSRAERQATLKAILKALEGGLSLRKAAKQADVHVATVCRWQKRFRTVKQVIRTAKKTGRQAKRPPSPPPSANPRQYLARKPSVPWHPDCPACGAHVHVRRAWGFLAFWRCSRWPYCAWTSWRPRAQTDCPRCGAARYWSWSRRSIGCPCCQLRVMCEQFELMHH